MLWIHLLKEIKDWANDPNLPVLRELERQRSGYWRRHIIQVIALLVLLSVLLFFWLRGWELLVP